MDTPRALAGGIVRIPSTPLLDPHVAPNSLAWRMGGADETYLAPPRRESSRNRADQRKNAGKARYTADSNMMDAIAATLNKQGVGSPGRLKGWLVRGIRAPVLGPRRTRVGGGGRATLRPHRHGVGSEAPRAWRS